MALDHLDIGSSQKGLFFYWLCYYVVMNSVGVYRSNKYTAYIYPKSVVICTNLQCVRITCGMWQNKHLLDSLIIDILRGKVVKLSDLKDCEGLLTWTHTSKPQA